MRKLSKLGKPGPVGASAGRFRFDTDRLLPGQGTVAGAGVSFVRPAQPPFTGPAKRTLWEAVDTVGRGKPRGTAITPSFAAISTARQAVLRRAQVPPVRKIQPAQKPQTVRKIQPRRVAEDVSQFSSAARPQAFKTPQYPENPLVRQRQEQAFAQGQPDTVETLELVKKARLGKWGVPEQDFNLDDWDALMAPEPPTPFSAPTWDKNYQIAQNALLQFNGNMSRDRPEVAAAKKAAREDWSNNLGKSLAQAYDGAMTTSTALDLDLAGDPMGAAFHLYHADRSGVATFGRGFGDNLGPSAGSVGGAGMGGSLLGTLGTLVGGPYLGAAGGIVGSIGGGYLGEVGVRRVQDEALQGTLSPPAYQALGQLKQEDQTERSTAYGLGQLSSQVVWLQPRSVGEVWEDGSLMARLLRPGGMAAEKAALGKLVGNGVGVALPVGQELLSAHQEGRPVNTGPLLQNVGMSLLLKNNQAGDALYNGGSIIGNGAANAVQRGARTMARSQPAIALRNDLSQRPFFTRSGWYQHAREVSGQANMPLLLTGPSIRRAPGEAGGGTLRSASGAVPNAGQIRPPSVALAATPTTQTSDTSSTVGPKPSAPLQKPGSMTPPQEGVTWWRTGSYKDLKKAGLKDRHHIIQDAAVINLAGYKYRKAPNVRLDGPSMNRSTAHGATRVVQMQSGGGTYAAERRIGYKALRKAGVTSGAARVMLRRADIYFKALGVTQTTPTEIPKDRPNYVKPDLQKP